jgi:plasmid stabilization system protein ParE
VKRVVFSPAALTRWRDIARYSAIRWGPARARAYRDQLIGRLQAVAAGALPHPLPCTRLLPDEPAAIRDLA